jgi:hypothetical protein
MSFNHQLTTIFKLFKYTQASYYRLTKSYYYSVTSTVDFWKAEVEEKSSINSFLVRSLKKRDNFQHIPNCTTFGVTFILIIS